jgi:hypothetical protein
MAIENPLVSLVEKSANVPGNPEYVKYLVFYGLLS